MDDHDDKEMVVGKKKKVTHLKSKIKVKQLHEIVSRAMLTMYKDYRA